MVGEFSAVLLEVAPPHVHTDPGSFILVALSSQGHWKGMGRYQAKSRGFISALHEQLRFNFCGTFQAGRAGEVRAVPPSSPACRASPSERETPLPGPFQAGVQPAVLDQRSQRGLCSDAPCESPPHRAASL